MQTKTKVILTVVAFTLVGFLIQSNSPIGALIWPPSADIPVPEGAQLPLLIGYGLMAAIGFGLAVAFLFFGRPLVARLGVSKGLTTAAHLSIVWVLGNWAIHDSLHITNGHNLWGLIAIEYGFHGTLIIAGAILAWTMVVVARNHTESTTRPAA
jgi:hypothetical protein